MTDEQGKEKKGGGRGPAIIIVILFMAPILGAWIMFNYFPDTVRHFGTTNHGEFVYPARAVHYGKLPILRGGDLKEDYLQGKWTIVYIDDSGCNALCRSNLVKTENIKIAQGPEMDRVQRLFVMIGKPPVDELKKFLQQTPDLTVVTADVPAAQGLLDNFTIKAGENLLQQHRIYLVDPRGELMMHYWFDPDDKELRKETGMRKDLKKLLKDSKIG